MPFKDLETRRRKAREYARRWREKHLTKAREVARVNHQNNSANWKPRESRAAYMRSYRKLNRERHAAYEAVKQALKIGQLVKPATCSECDVTTKDLEAHHPSGYTKSFKLTVYWLCRGCHRRKHPVDAKPYKPRFGQRKAH